MTQDFALPRISRLFQVQSLLSLLLVVIYLSGCRSLANVGSDSDSIQREVASDPESMDDNLLITTAKKDLFDAHLIVCMLPYASYFRNIPIKYGSIFKDNGTGETIYFGTSDTGKDFTYRIRNSEGNYVPLTDQTLKTKLDRLYEALKANAQYSKNSACFGESAF